MKAYMALDQYGGTHHIGFTRHPRKSLLEMLGGTSARKMYQDTVDGESRHVGWIIEGLWLTVYEVTPADL